MKQYLILLSFAISFTSYALSEESNSPIARKDKGKERIPYYHNTWASQFNDQLSFLFFLNSFIKNKKKYSIEEKYSAEETAYDLLGLSRQKIIKSKIAELGIYQRQEEIRRNQRYELLKKSISWLNSKNFALGFLLISILAVVTSKNVPIVKKKLNFCANTFNAYTNPSNQLRRANFSAILNNFFQQLYLVK